MPGYKIKIISLAAVILWMMLIFNMSSQVAEDSNRLSTGVTEIIVRTIEMVAPKADFDLGSVNHLVRKNAHFFAYLVLGVLVVNAVRRSGAGGYGGLLLAAGICLLYAVSDEVHQLFIPGRGGQVRDVIIDGAGAVLGLGAYLIAGRLLRRKKQNVKK
jgi:VanZ family protein